MVGATQVDAALWESGSYRLTRSAGKDVHVRTYTPNANIERDQSEVLPIPYLAAWEEKVLKYIPPLTQGLKCKKEYCNGIQLEHHWIAPVCGPDGTFESIMSYDWRPNQTAMINITDFSGTNICSTFGRGQSKLLHLPVRIMRISKSHGNKGEVMFVIIEQIRKHDNTGHDVCVHGVFKVWDETVAQRPKGYRGTYRSHKTVFPRNLNLFDRSNFRVLFTNDFMIDPPVPSIGRSLTVYRYWFCQQEESLKVAEVSLDKFQQPHNLVQSAWTLNPEGWSYPSTIGSTLYIFSLVDSSLKSWDVSIQSLAQGKFGEPLGTHRFVGPSDWHPNQPVCELDGGRMIIQMVSELAVVFGPKPLSADLNSVVTQNSAEAESTGRKRPTPENDENFPTKKPRVVFSTSSL